MLSVIVNIILVWGQEVIGSPKFSQNQTMNEKNWQPLTDGPIEFEE